jgi:hypothetical protein
MKSDAFATTSGDVAIKCVYRSIYLSANKPFCVRRIPFQNLIPLFIPSQLALVLPKRLNDLYLRVHIDQVLRWLARQMQGSVERAGSPAKDFQLNRRFFLNS